MSDCCTSDGSKPQRSAVAECPTCGNTGRAVPTLTVKNLVIDHTRVVKDQSYSFCRTPNCDAVYFAPDAVFGKADIKVRVGLKEQAHPIPLCYCFGYTHEDIQREIAQRSLTDIPERIKAEIQSGFCACEVKNPSGYCCLGDITRAIQEFKQAASREVAPPD